MRRVSPDAIRNHMDYIDQVSTRERPYPAIGSIIAHMPSIEMDYARLGLPQPTTEELIQHATVEAHARFGLPRPEEIPPLPQGI